MGFRTYPLNPVTTRRSVNAPGTGVPPARANSTNVRTAGARPTTISATPMACATRPIVDVYSTFQPVISHGIHTAPSPAAMANQRMLPTAAVDRRTRGLDDRG